MKVETPVEKTTIEICVNAIDKHLNELKTEQWSKSALKNLETKLLFLEKRSNEISVRINNYLVFILIFEQFNTYILINDIY